MDNKLRPPQWKTSTDHHVGLIHRVRCIEDRLGSNLPRKRYRRPLDGPGKSPSHKLPQIESSLLSPQVLCEGSQQCFNFTSAGQHNGHSLYQQNGWNPLSTPFQFSSGNMELVLREGDNNPCRASPRSGECASRLAFSAPGDWKLHPDIFLSLEDLFGPFSIDLFASRTNHQLPVY